MWQVIFENNFHRITTNKMTNFLLLINSFVFCFVPIFVANKWFTKIFFLFFLRKNWFRKINGKKIIKKNKGRRKEIF